MRFKKWESFLCICASCTLLMSTAASANPAAITPLEESQVFSLQSRNQTSDQAAVSFQGSGSGSGSDGGVTSSDGSSLFGSPSLSGSPSPAGSPFPPGSPSLSGSPSWNPTTGQAAGGNSGGIVSPGETAGTAAGTFDQTVVASVQKPEIVSEGAMPMDAVVGTVLFSKNGNEQSYPAGITKLMTALLVAKNCNLGDKVTFSATAIVNLEVGVVSINMTAGDVTAVRQCLYVLFLKSANEVENALAEHVAGSNAKFAETMNAKAVALGCTNTHFTNPHGLNDPNHYIAPHDMALTARVALQNDVVKTVTSTRTYTLPTTIRNPSGLTVTVGHKMLNPNDARYYPGVIGGKTGYASKAGNTLVTAVEKDGIRLIAVVMKSKSTHYTDTKALFDYGYGLVKAGASSGSGSSTGSSNSAGTTGSPPGTGNAGPGISLAKGWVQDNNGWYYVKDNGAKAASEWITVDGVSYWVDSNTYMVKGWRQINGEWHFPCPDRVMAKNQWEKVEENGQWFYLGVDGVMLINTTTSDGSRVDESGAWVW